MLKGHLGNDVYIKVPKRFIGGIDGCRVLFDSEWILLLASSVNEDEQGTITVMKNTNGTRSTTTTTIIVLWLIHHFFLKKGFIQVSGQWKYLC